MKINFERIVEHIHQGESLTVEFKECQNDISRDVYESVCAFLNRNGGTLYLGVSDNGKVLGVNPAFIAQIKKDFVTAIHNPLKINPPCYLSVNEAMIDNKTILSVYVPESSQVHRCNGKIYDRNEDGDLDITNHTQMVSELYHRKIITYSENKIYPYATIDDLRPDLLVKVRKIVNNLRKDHPWLTMNDMELIKSAQLYQTDLESGKSGITLAGILLLGKDETILSVAPAYRTDLILRKRNLDRYDDRDDVRTNLIESYERIMAFVAKHLPDPFYLEGDQRISIRDVIFREVASNILIHRDFINPFPAKLIIENDLVRTENSNKPHGHGPINPENFSPFPKNPVIARFFREINRADELGSGVRNLMKYGKAYGGKSPELIEEDIFRIVVWIPSDNQNKDSKVDDHTLTRLESRLESRLSSKIMILLQSKPMGKTEIAKMLGHKGISGALNKQIKRLLSLGLIELTLPEIPTSRLQQYCISLKGSDLIKSLE